jgi:glyoxylase-like metal-dependent hydrolase (beta-lactamase superfamily II)
VMWDCVHLLDDEGAQQIERRGGLRAIAISHPHYYTGMVEWAQRFGCPVYIHAADERWVMRPDPAIEVWEGETKELGDGLTLIRCGGHFAGGTVLHWAGGDALLSGDIVQVIPDRSHVGFMYSYPNLIPLPATSVEAIAGALEPFEFDVVYGAWWGRIVRGDAKGIVQRSAERYVRALAGDLPEGA